MPQGVPIAIIPFLIPIEVISYMSRVISLSVRLFANMMSGHTLLKILGGFL
jgi:F-type H+-transporting ATPase subunit a